MICRKGLEYVSTIESKHHPFFGTQWHPEKPPFEFAMEVRRPVPVQPGIEGPSAKSLCSLALTAHLAFRNLAHSRMLHAAHTMSPAKMHLGAPGHACEHIVCCPSVAAICIRFGVLNDPSCR